MFVVLGGALIRALDFFYFGEVQMSHWRRINYSVSLAVIVTALALFFMEHGVLPLVPGFLFEVLLGFVIIIDPEEILLTEHAWGGNVVVYSALFYILSWVFTGLSEQIQKSHSTTAKSNNGMHPTANSVAFIRKTWPCQRCVRGG